MGEQEEWNSEVPANYERKLMEARRAAKNRRYRLAIEQARRARQREEEAAGGTPAAGGTTAVTTTQAPRPPVYVKPTKTIPQHPSGAAGVALRKSKRKGKARKGKSRKSRR
jgi:hypothetical protein